MAQRRMFSQDIVSSDAFLDMPISSQVLYFHLGIRADDDGFVTPKMVMRLVGSSSDDLKVLISKRFLLPFESGVVVIKHWLIHNLIRADMYKETMYKKEKEQLGLNESGAYTELREGVAEIKQIEAPEWLKRRRKDVCTESVPQTVHRIGEDRLGKDSIGKVNTTETSVSFLEVLPEQLKAELSEKYQISPKGIQSKATDLLLYCKQKGKSYKDYKAFLENALRKDKGTLQTAFPLVKRQVDEAEPELTPEQIKANQLRIQEIKSNLLTKFKS
jgi:hypothetical protein